MIHDAQQVTEYVNELKTEIFKKHLTFHLMEAV
ncbi:hypothetical protein RUMOBE_02580 [Blautia obeum ATCC 29174]|uniref:Uncharacterized protein n=1 Tax=Blautia obeum ATCC 29174 TaxID=411459 RepID=A5ZU97_9FIRM|nr:hypothetical protein RUMOBE_02580 [Blautia obeum ATCC 29174]